MGCRETITHDTFPKQGNRLGERVSICFHYDTSHAVSATVIRDDMEEPFDTIFVVTQGPHIGKIIRSSECQYQ